MYGKLPVQSSQAFCAFGPARNSSGHLSTQTCRLWSEYGAVAAHTAQSLFSSGALPAGQLVTHACATWSANGVPPLHSTQSFAASGACPTGHTATQVVPRSEYGVSPVHGS